MQITFVSRHVLFFVSYLKATENKLENAAFFRTIKEGVGESYNPTSLVTIEISAEMFIKTIGLVTNERHGLSNSILTEAMKAIGTPQGYVSLEQQLGAVAMNPQHPDHAEATTILTRLTETRSAFAASLEADYVQSTLAWLNSITF